MVSPVRPPWVRCWYVLTLWCTLMYPRSNCLAIIVFDVAGRSIFFALSQFSCSIRPNLVSSVTWRPSAASPYLANPTKFNVRLGLNEFIIYVYFFQLVGDCDSRTRRITHFDPHVGVFRISSNHPRGLRREINTLVSRLELLSNSWFYYPANFQFYFIFLIFSYCLRSKKRCNLPWPTSSPRQIFNDKTFFGNFMPQATSMSSLVGLGLYVLFNCPLIAVICRPEAPFAECCSWCVYWVFPPPYVAECLLFWFF